MQRVDGCADLCRHIRSFLPQGGVIDRCHLCGCALVQRACRLSFEPELTRPHVTLLNLSLCLPCFDRNAEHVVEKRALQRQLLNITWDGRKYLTI